MHRPINSAVSAVALLALFTVVIALTFEDYGISWDEFFRWGGGDSKLAYYEALVSGENERAIELRSATDHYPGFY
ncbi:hypothetical protein, partial [Cerasicoccus arenae]